MDKRQTELLAWLEDVDQICDIKLSSHRTIITGFKFQRFEGTTVYGNGYKKWRGGAPYAPRDHEINGDVCFDINQVARWQPMNHPKISGNKPTWD
jgi:hypothetical protein